MVTGEASTTRCRVEQAQTRPRRREGDPRRKNCPFKSLNMMMRIMLEINLGKTLTDKVVRMCHLKSFRESALQLLYAHKTCSTRWGGI